jgi:hypothetical protein
MYFLGSCDPPLRGGGYTPKAMHVNSETVLNLIDGSISETDRTHCENHLQSCAQCATDYQTWAAFMGLVKRPHLISAPAEAIISAQELLPISRPPQIRPSLRQIVAGIVFDSFAQPALSSVRAEAAGYEQIIQRQVVLQAEEFDIHVRVSMFEDHRDLLGQILPRGKGFIKEASLYLRHDDERIRSANVNELGEFEFCDVPVGMLSLQIDLPTVTIISTLDTNLPSS